MSKKNLKTSHAEELWFSKKPMHAALGSNTIPVEGHLSMALKIKQHCILPHRRQLVILLAYVDIGDQLRAEGITYFLLLNIKHTNNCEMG